MITGNNATLTINGKTYPVKAFEFHYEDRTYLQRDCLIQTCRDSKEQPYKLKSDLGVCCECKEKPSEFTQDRKRYCSECFFKKNHLAFEGKVRQTQ